MGGPFGLVVNPAAGRGRSLRVLAETTAALDAAGAAYRVTESASLDHARDLATQAGQRGHVVVAVGGDVPPHAAQLAKVKSGSHLGLPQISTDRAAEVTITVGRDLPAAADGESLPGAAPLRSGTRLRVRALPGALRVLVPAGG